LEIGRNLFDNRVYAEHGNVPTESAAWRPPLWPVLLSLFMWVTIEPSGLIIMKILLEAILVALVIGELWKKKTRWLFSGVLIFGVALEPQVLKYSTTFLSEGISAILLLMAVAIFFKREHPKTLYLLSLILGLLILLHPVTIFFALLILAYVSIETTRDKKFGTLIFVNLIFLIVVSSWAFRNAFVFERGIFLTASQGATFSKGWNADVAANFTNTQGDLADEGRNTDLLNIASLEGYSILDLKEIYTRATFLFLNSSPFTELVQIALVKLNSNFNPFPETPKPGILELAGSVFRSFYLLTFLPLFFLVRKWKQTDRLTRSAAVSFLIIYLSQSLMSVMIYTGLRFNAVYGAALLLCSLIIWRHLFLNLPLMRRSKSNSLA
jgi:4-amino-4-deoxy-L-arabinose transferase-like glycosyltransferase